MADVCTCFHRMLSGGRAAARGHRHRQPSSNFHQAAPRISRHRNSRCQSFWRVRCIIIRCWCSSSGQWSAPQCCSSQGAHGRRGTPCRRTIQQEQCWGGSSCGTEGGTGSGSSGWTGRDWRGRVPYGAVPASETVSHFAGQGTQSLYCLSYYWLKGSCSWCVPRWC